MKKLIFAVLLLAGMGCKNQKPADNSMTRYTEALQKDTEKAAAVADKADALIKKQNDEYNKIANDQ